MTSSARRLSTGGSKGKGISRTRRRSCYIDHFGELSKKAKGDFRTAPPDTPPLPGVLRRQDFRLGLESRTGSFGDRNMPLFQGNGKSSMTTTRRSCSMGQYYAAYHRSLNEVCFLELHPDADQNGVTSSSAPNSPDTIVREVSVAKTTTPRQRNISYRTSSVVRTWSKSRRRLRCNMDAPSTSSTRTRFCASSQFPPPQML